MGKGTVANDKSDIQTLGGNLPLGKDVVYCSTYSPELLCALPRLAGRETLGIDNDALPFDGFDSWNAYEVSWLEKSGKPVVAMAQFRFPCDSPGIVESKSFKLYLNSFNQSRFSDSDEVRQILIRDLSAAVQAGVEVELRNRNDFAEPQQFIGVMPGDCIDDEPVSIEEYTVNPALLETEGNTKVEETLHSHLLKTNCPVTGQPDWASVLIRYRGNKISRAGLLRYLCSFREHNDFHEQCVEMIFRDIIGRCDCESLTVEAHYTRRGGLDINPLRSNCNDKPALQRMLRQ